MNGLDFGTAIGLIKGLGSPDPAVIESAVSEWLDDHPEATTTVQDGSITKAKLDSNLQGTFDDVADLKSEFDSITDGTPISVNVLTDATLINGNYAKNDKIDEPTASDYRKVYPTGFALEDNHSFVFDSDSGYNIAFAAFDSDDVCISVANSWLSDGTYTAAQVKSNARNTNAAKYSFQIKAAGGEKVNGLTIKAFDYCALNKSVQLQIDEDAIKDASIAENKLSSELQNKINSLIPPTNQELLSDANLIIGAYAVNDMMNSPSGGMDGSRKSYPNGFALTDDLIFITDTGGAYNVAFCAFDTNGKCISTPNTWLTDGTYSAAQIMANARSYVGAKYTFQIKKVSGTGAIGDVSTLNYYSLKSTGAITTVDVFMFMGQSNMAGRGEVANAPTIITGAGWEYRAISAPNALYPMAEPFGATEAKSGGIDEGSSKTGSMVTAFANAYYQHNGHIPVVGVAASKGGTPISDWQPEGAYLTDAIDRFGKCVTYLTSKGYTIRHKYILWCQGETDGDNSTTAENYKSLFDTMLAEMLENGIEKLFMVRIGNYNSGTSTKYETIMDCQTEIAQTEADVIMASTDFAGMRERGLMKDTWHYYQAGYNEVGTYSGINVAIYVNTGKEPTMYDTQDGTLYYTHKN